MSIDWSTIEKHKITCRVCRRCTDEGLPEPKKGCYGDCPSCGKFLAHEEAHAEDCTLEPDYKAMNAASDEMLSGEGIVVRHVIAGPSGLPVEVTSEYRSTTTLSFGEGVIIPMTFNPELDAQREMVEAAIERDLGSLDTAIISDVVFRKGDRVEWEGFGGVAWTGHGEVTGIRRKSPGVDVMLDIRFDRSEELETRRRDAASSGCWTGSGPYPFGDNRNESVVFTAEGVKEAVESRKLRVLGHADEGQASTGLPEARAAFRDRMDAFLRPAGDEHVRPWARALAERGNVTLEEWENLRANSYEFELIYPKLTDEALVYAGQNIVGNCQFDWSRPWRSYNEACMGFLAPELLKRLDDRVQRAKDPSLASERAALNLDKRVLRELLTCADSIDSAADAIEGLDDDIDGESAEAREHASEVRDLAAEFAAARGLPVEGVEQRRTEAIASLKDMRKLYPDKTFAANSEEWLAGHDRRHVTARRPSHVAVDLGVPHHDDAPPESQRAGAPPPASDPRHPQTVLEDTSPLTLPVLSEAPPASPPNCCTKHRASEVKGSCCSEACECDIPEGSIGGACFVCKRTIQ